MVTVAADVELARHAAAQVLDPEVPVLTIADLGVLRDVVVLDDGAVEVVITPTYSGCPAMETIASDVLDAVRAAGFDDVRVRTVLSPAWTTDWMSDDGRRKLAEYGIAPPTTRTTGPVPLTLGSRPAAPTCPRCGSADVRELSHFGSTACKSLWQCSSCREPFDHFKAI
ncbi:1,2-phenylacetyl-CoA epoxidase subunit PaaD [Angustibacter sp. Root456]|uniref:1,2-phenylacetyl-CoA epoxidase subunit PaaD n=1 Tax=Angustibacter sp. Root456 TaxID=1736539 RepID=UPI000700BEF9|nr:phenylacetate-CoA oxygenase subunit PaaJ [Angustibacter sp. Root456]